MVLNADIAYSQEFITLARWISGDFSNQQQAFDAPTKFAHIRILFRPLPSGFFPGLGLYSEQTYDYDRWTPYRQGIHRLVDRGDHVYIENYGLKDRLLYAGAGHNTEILKTITPDCIERREGCSMVFRRQGDTFIGSVEPGKACIIPKEGKLTYLTSHVEITESTWMSIDQGMDVDTDEYVWGSTEGVLQFRKCADFDGELPF
ncbi:MAG: chromophore lyase CpcT/CpeT [Cyanobacteria bacterium P01_H01_bin.26]